MPYPPRVKIVDLDMPFWSMVRFMMKWAIASIPAALLLFALMTWGFAFLFGLLAALR